MPKQVLVPGWQWAQLGLHVQPQDSPLSLFGWFCQGFVVLHAHLVTTHTPKAGESRNSQLHILTYLGIAALNNNHSFAKSANTFEFFRYLQVVPNEVCFLL